MALSGCPASPPGGLPTDCHICSMEAGTRRTRPVAATNGCRWWLLFSLTSIPLAAAGVVEGACPPCRWPPWPNRPCYCSPPANSQNPVDKPGTCDPRKKSCIAGERKDGKPRKRRPIVDPNDPWKKAAPPGFRKPLIVTGADALGPVVREIFLPLFLATIFLFHIIGPLTLLQKIKSKCNDLRGKPPGTKKEDHLAKGALIQYKTLLSQRKWAPVWLIGPLPPSIVGWLLMFVGQIYFFATYEMSTNNKCFPVKMGLLGAICVAHLFVGTFFWSYCGYRYDFTFRLRGKMWRSWRNKKISINITREYPSLGHLVAHYLDLYILTLASNGYFSMQLISEHEKGPCEKYGLLSFCWFIVVLTWIVFGCVTNELIKLTASSYGIGTYGNPEEETRESLQKKRADRLAGGGEDSDSEEDENHWSKWPIEEQPDAEEPLGYQAVRNQFVQFGDMDNVEADQLVEVLKYLRLRLEVPQIEAAKEELVIDNLVTFDMFYEWYEAYYEKKMYPNGRYPGDEEGET